MSTVEEIKAAVAQLSERDARELAGWIQEIVEARWDRQIELDIAAGKLDKLAEQAMGHYRAGRVKPLNELLKKPWQPT